MERTKREQEEIKGTGYNANRQKGRRETVHRRPAGERHAGSSGGRRTSGTAMRRKRRRRQKRIIHLRRLGLALSLLALLLVAADFVSGLSASGGELLGFGGIGGLSGSSFVSEDGAGGGGLFSSDTAKKDTAPQAMDIEEARRQLRKLAKTDKKYQEICDHMEDYPEDLLKSLCNNPEMLEFAAGYLTADKTAVGGFTMLEKHGSHPIILQWDKRWGYAPYGESDIALAGCAPTCLSMVILELTGNGDATPDAVADYAMEWGYYVPGTGTDWSLMTEGGRRFGVKGKELSLDEERIADALADGHPIICSLRPGDFTTTGHFIVLVGEKDGKIIVRDPNSRSRSERLWDYETLAPQIKNLWKFDRI